MSSAIDHEKKKLYESIEAIAKSNDEMVTIARMLRLMHERKAYCINGLKVGADKEYISQGVAVYNQQIKTLLNI